MALGDDLGQRAVDVGAEADQVLDLGGPGRHLAGAGEPGVVHGQADEVELVLAVEDGEVGLIAQQRRRPPEQAIADVVERPGPDPVGLLADQGFEPADHLPRRASGEGHQHDRLGGHAGGDQVGDAEGDHPRLARSRPGQDQVVAVGRGHRCPLRLVQLALEVLAEPGRRRRFQSDLPHRCHHGARIPGVPSFRENGIIAGEIPFVDHEIEEGGR